MQNLNTPVVLTNQGYQVQNLSLLSMAKEYGTPLYIYDLNHIGAQHDKLNKLIGWRNLKIFYAMKANYNLDILKHLCERGACIDAVSPPEVLVALRAGFSKDRILYTANNLTLEDMSTVHELGVMLNIDSLSCLDRYGSAFPGSEVCLRFNSDVIAGENSKVQTGGDKTKFGIRLESADEALAIAARHRLKIVGLHEHTGSGIAEADSFYQGMKNLLSIATKERFPDLRFVDFGGGFKVPYRPDEKPIDYETFGQKVTAIFSDFCKNYGRELEMYFEPGKYMVAEGGIFLLTINTIKNNRGRLFAGTDSGFGHLMRPMLYDAYHHILNLSNPQGTPTKYDICGNICETGDLFASERDVPEIREGDVIALLNAGAYCMSMASVYNLRPLPTEVVIKDGKVSLSRLRATHKDFANEICALYDRPIA